MAGHHRGGPQPGRIIPTVLRRFADAHPDRHVRIIGEPIWAGRSATGYPACAQHEALINHAFDGRDVTIVCPYDTAALEPSVVADARETHPEVWEASRRYASADYAPDDVVARYNQPVPAAAPVEFAVTGDWGCPRGPSLGGGAGAGVRPERGPGARPGADRHRAGDQQPAAPGRLVPGRAVARGRPPVLRRARRRVPGGPAGRARVAAGAPAGRPGAHVHATGPDDAVRSAAPVITAA
ncbi:putative anti-sigma regulatory factor, serine/threonine protein kinase [Amycolatopsis methanolica 239]|uniref:Putative anti-sigma regulatory factor, serine/threonine protein kinase n=1 Tax=Amycolatopsis methanolica 239 TaxID=1068978 RepID=A0A076N2M3_AMYME|nr:putative anti-sigma regulatory factor, serine/threonine protein kinase [Amycolatopsis methanolica 239]